MFIVAVARALARWVFLYERSRVEESPNWVKRSRYKRVAGQQIPGWPYKEGAPKNIWVKYELILDDATRTSGKVDLTGQDIPDQGIR